VYDASDRAPLEPEYRARVSRHYLDHASAWPVRPEAARAHADALTVAWGDPARRHAEGRAARRLLDQATGTVAGILGAEPDGVVWTASGTEAVALAVTGSALAAVRRGDPRRHLVVSAVEHSSVLRSAQRLASEHGFTVTTVGVDRAGLVDPDRVAAALTPDTLAVHLQHANHEVGAVQPTHEVGAVCRSRNILLHVDACQTVGQLGVTLAQVGADLLTASGAKFGGPPGCGFVVLGEHGRVSPLIEGDDHQRGRRAGHPDVPAIAATAVALQVATTVMDTERSTREVVRRHLRARLPEAVPDLAVHGPLADAHPGIVAASALYVDGEALVSELDAAGFALHSGSSCASTSGDPSHVLVAMQVLTHGHVRISFGPEFTTTGADDLVAAMAETVTRLRPATPEEPR
jgi:cysteine desulfurase